MAWHDGTCLALQKDYEWRRFEIQEFNLVISEYHYIVHCIITRYSYTMQCKDAVWSQFMTACVHESLGEESKIAAQFKLLFLMHVVDFCCCAKIQSTPIQSSTVQASNDTHNSTIRKYPPPPTPTAPPTVVIVRQFFEISDVIVSLIYDSIFRESQQKTHLLCVNTHYLVFL